MNNDRVEVRDGSAAGFIGPDAVNLYAVTVTISAIRMYLKCGIKASRMHTPTNMKAFATRYTGKAYPRSRAGLQAAMDDLIIWRDNMKAALPVIDADTGEQL